MKYYFLTDESERSLAPFFSKIMVAAPFFCVLTVSGFILLLWPRQSLYSYIGSNSAPILFFLGFGATHLLLAYVSLCCGRGELSLKNYYSRYGSDVSTYEKEFDFMRYGLVAALIHTLILILVCLPVLILCAAVSCMSLIGFIKALFIVYTASLFCRLAGFLCYLFWGRLSALGYVAARLVMIAFVFGTYAFARNINPLHILYTMNTGPGGMGAYLDHAYGIYMVSVGLAIIFLVGTNHILVGRSIDQEKRCER